ncbi:hypothetical protein GGI26_004051 [Coemansia sp. RSA 1358]|nr:hypothetical protein GGI26_004051 [Coemansia sp. RSA 1358]
MTNEQACKPFYTLRYFPVPARADTCKALLALSGVEWKLESPAWPKGKDSQPVGKMPVLIEAYSGDNATAPFVLGESYAIEEYIATKYNLFYQPDDLQMMARQRELRSQMVELYEYVSDIMHGPEASRAGLLEKYKVAGRYIVRFHEKVLRENGSNGHYFGDKTTFADVAALASVFGLQHTFADLDPSMIDFISEDNAPEINNLVNTLSKDPALASYVAGFKK